jgi:hypothetical protein
MYRATGGLHGGLARPRACTMIMKNFLFGRLYGANARSVYTSKFLGYDAMLLMRGR